MLQKQYENGLKFVKNIKILSTLDKQCREALRRLILELFLTRPHHFIPSTISAATTKFMTYKYFVEKFGLCKQFFLVY